MYRPLRPPRGRPRSTDPTGRGLLVSSGLVAAVPFLLWAANNPLAGIIVLALLAGLFVTARGAWRVGRCYRHCGEFAVRLGRSTRITVTRLPSEEPG